MLLFVGVGSRSVYVHFGTDNFGTSFRYKVYFSKSFYILVYVILLLENNAKVACLSPNTNPKSGGGQKQGGQSTHRNGHVLLM
jgi:hypothetical protein